MFQKVYGKRYKGCKKTGGRGRDHFTGSEQALNVMECFLKQGEAYYAVRYLESDANRLCCGAPMGEAARLKVHAGDAWGLAGSKTSEKRDDVVAFSSPESLIHQRTVFWEGLTQQQKDQVVTRGISWPQEVL